MRKGIRASEREKERDSMVGEEQLPRFWFDEPEGGKSFVIIATIIERFCSFQLTIEKKLASVHLTRCNWLENDKHSS